jgi:hypothetical protein
VNRIHYSSLHKCKWTMWNLLSNACQFSFPKCLIMFKIFSYAYLYPLYILFIEVLHHALYQSMVWCAIVFSVCSLCFHPLDMVFHRIKNSNLKRSTLSIFSLLVWTCIVQSRNALLSPIPWKFFLRSFLKFL